MAKTHHQHPRLLLPKFLSLQECKELESIHKSSSTVGYRSNVLSTTLSHLIATDSPHFLMPFVPIRERLKDKVEDYFGCQYELFVEFTALISWIKGASIGWHSDDNRPYLKQRAFSAVCYLNNYGDDFSGGLFHFQDGEPLTVVPSIGDAVIYSADSRNIHSVDEIIDGERLTLALWFSRDSGHDEDIKLISMLSESGLHSNRLCIPKPASSNMYWFSPSGGSEDRSGFDICWARLSMLGFDILYSQDNTEHDDFLMEPLRLARGNQLFDHEFANILHALQVVQFYCWKASESETSHVETESREVFILSESHQQRINAIKSMFSKDDHLAKTVFGRVVSESTFPSRQFDWNKLATAIPMWDNYVHISHQGIVKSLPYWKAQQSIFCVSFDET